MLESKAIRGTDVVHEATRRRNEDVDLAGTTLEIPARVGQSVDRVGYSSVGVPEGALSHKRYLLVRKRVLTRCGADLRGAVRMVNF